MPILILPLLSRDVDSLDHPAAAEYRKMLEEGAKAYGGQLTTFAIDHGVIACGLTSDEMVRDMLADMAAQGISVDVVPDKEAFGKEARKILDERRRRG